MTYSPDTEWPVEYTDECETWWESLTEAEQEDVAAKVILLQRLGPALPGRTPMSCGLPGMPI